MKKIALQAEVRCIAELLCTCRNLHQKVSKETERLSGKQFCEKYGLIKKQNSFIIHTTNYCYVVTVSPGTQVVEYAKQFKTFEIPFVCISTREIDLQSVIANINVSLKNLTMYFTEYNRAIELYSVFLSEMDTECDKFRKFLSNIPQPLRELARTKIRSA
jgi:hypothetical protein